MCWKHTQSCTNISGPPEDTLEAAAPNSTDPSPKPRRALPLAATWAGDLPNGGRHQELEHNVK